MRYLYLICCTISVSWLGCREKFDLPDTTLADNALVVEANINPGNGPTQVRLTRAFGLSDTARLVVEANATVAVEANDNSQFPLNNNGGGYYAANLVLDPSKQYRLKIRTSNGKEYVSSFQQAKTTPPVDSISWNQESDGVSLFANTHDPSGNSRYYKWEYEQTWEIRTYYTANVIMVGNDSIRRRNYPSESVSTCWKMANSTSILLANSERLQDDIIYRAPLLTIPNADERLVVRYSILLRQYAIDKDAYHFFEVLKRNTEEIGSILGPLPSELRGNITCTTDPSEYVIGYVTASSIQEKRIFIDRSQITGWQFYQNCESTVTVNRRDSIRFYYSLNLLPYDHDEITGEVFFSRPPCVDCTRRGGALTRPVFW